MRELSLLNGLVLLVFAIALLVEYFKYKQRAKLYRQYAFFLVGLCAILQIVSILIIPSGYEILILPFPLITLILSFLMLFVYVTVGSYHGQKLGRYTLPLLKQLFRKIRDRKVQLLEFSWKNYWLAIIGVAGLATIYTRVLFYFVTPELSETLKRIADSQQNVSIFHYISMFIIVIEASVREEILFRFALKNYISTRTQWLKDNYWFPVVVTSLLWAIGHNGVVDPAWVKLVQIFPIGIAFSFLYKKYGLESSILAHMIFNVVNVFIPFI